MFWDVLKCYTEWATKWERQYFYELCNSWNYSNRPRRFRSTDHARIEDPRKRHTTKHKFPRYARATRSSMYPGHEVSFLYQPRSRLESILRLSCLTAFNFSFHAIGVWERNIYLPQVKFGKKIIIRYTIQSESFSKISTRRHVNYLFISMLVICAMVLLDFYKREKKVPWW